MAKLAIKGHATRGKEVIEILEMLGGKNDNRCCGGFINRIYLINENGYIESCDRMHHLDYLQLTLEEFFEKFPYKIGNKILYNTYGIYTKIKTMLWNVENIVCLRTNVFVPLSWVVGAKAPFIVCIIQPCPPISL